MLQDEIRTFGQQKAAVKDCWISKRCLSKSFQPLLVSNALRKNTPLTIHERRALRKTAAAAAAPRERNGA